MSELKENDIDLDIKKENKLDYDSLFKKDDFILEALQKNLITRSSPIDSISRFLVRLKDFKGYDDIVECWKQKNKIVKERKIIENIQTDDNQKNKESDDDELSDHKSPDEESSDKIDQSASSNQQTAIMTDQPKIFSNYKAKEGAYNILSIYDKPLPAGWEKFFTDIRENLEHLQEKLFDKVEKDQVTPSEEDVFNLFYKVSPKNIKVIIIGQDPYYSSFQYKGQTYNTAVGYSFGTHPFSKVPPSLSNIFKEIRRTHDNFEYKNGDLTPWLEQGVFMYNMALTTMKGRAEAHSEKWRAFTNLLLDELVKLRQKPIFVLWGSHARAIKSRIGEKCPIFESGHPSPMSIRYFENNNHFVLIDEKLKEKKMTPIDWNLCKEESDKDENKGE